MKTTEKEAISLALKALEACRVMGVDETGRYTIEVTPKIIMKAIDELHTVLAEQPAPVVLTDAEIVRIAKEVRAPINTGKTAIRLVRAALAAAIPPGHVVIKDEPVARMLTWRGPSHTPTPPRAARTYAEFPEDAALPANKEAYWENAEPLYAARPGGEG